jgi:light-regulated signal transduction histidine kinase (bacteriophytochrome)
MQAKNMQPMPSPYTPVKDMAPPRGDHNTDQSLTHMQRELDTLAYVISHNLQSPLRSILSCCDEIQSHPGIKSKSLSREEADTLSAETKRLKEMMGLVVDYIQLETHAVTHQHVDCNEVMETVLTMLSEEIRESGAQIHCEKLPVVWGHHGRLTRLFAYLIDNAIKFRGNKPCVIDITSHNNGTHWEISIQDNGIGIDPDNHDIIFRLFKRLHTIEEYPGHGAGLALSHKIVEAHHGTIHVDSIAGEGSRFYMELPMNKQSINAGG